MMCFRVDSFTLFCLWFVKRLESASLCPSSNLGTCHPLGVLLQHLSLFLLPFQDSNDINVGYFFIVSLVPEPLFVVYFFLLQGGVVSVCLFTFVFLNDIFSWLVILGDFYCSIFLFIGSFLCPLHFLLSTSALNFLISIIIFFHFLKFTLGSFCISYFFVRLSVSL